MMNREEMKKALAILMLSPMYFKLKLEARKVLLREFCDLHLRQH